jgi:hypothetical protein
MKREMKTPQARLVMLDKDGKAILIHDRITPYLTVKG